MAEFVAGERISDFGWVVPLSVFRAYPKTYLNVILTYYDFVKG